MKISHPDADRQALNDAYAEAMGQPQARYPAAPQSGKEMVGFSNASILLTITGEMATGQKRFAAAIGKELNWNTMTCAFSHSV